ncbi:DSBA-like thioredoxin domain protein [Ehrlichia chaffeensis str. Heartland]|uniref:Disulfide oxidoreductase n=8 Tax=Ehrlichia TaxID=943 RepID=Q2GHG9_EHRCR|nr:DsbA family protein [Ehrlichia chaffeensis]AAM22615.1 disulfide oxidoreductase [Ehrlichia chaffeensis]ABD45310.1 disulfide oxidoreductase [Ehrlichia chaffeensis str. Arkansas]AHX03408.1 DSBA-like thioredoxin domain protein [Ehrlichia chaffeensis str. Heartland]AHX05871.1 DSBA-like thioredoxin domain protein [Ehrlichia chaffeensis str. Jax]AHX06862.1 DSBA-like thioredoxin domain protein [Ehrlichia chaffeensis str. Liberty]
MLRILFLLSLVILVASFPLINNWLSSKSGKTIIDKDTIISIVEEYIANYPQKVIDLLTRGQAQAENEEMSKNIKKYKSELEDSSYPSAGNKDSKIVFVEFFDYSCGYCKMMSEDMKQIIQDGKVRVIFRDFPILGEASLKAVQAALAVHLINPSKYIEFYHAALNHKQQFNDESILSLVKSIGIAEEDFKVSLAKNSDTIEKMIQSTKELAQNINIRGTPAIIIGDTFIGGAADISTLRSKIDEQG